MTDIPFTIHEVIEAAVTRAVTKTTGNPPDTVHAMIRLYVEEDVQAWIDANMQFKPATCQATNTHYPDAYINGVRRCRCVLPPGHEPIALTIDRTHIDQDGDTW